MKFRDAVDLVLKFIREHFGKITIFLLIVYLLPPLFLGENTHVFVADNIDSDIAQRIALVQSGKVFALNPMEIVPNYMGGLPRACFPEFLNLVMLLYFFFSPFIAYIINDTVVHIAAFIGMCLFTRKYIFTAEGTEWISYGIAFCFAILPFHSGFGLTIAGLPLLLLALFNVMNGEKKKFRDWIVIVLFPLYSSFILIGVYLVGVIFLMFLVDSIAKKKFDPALFGLWAAFTGIYLLAEYQFLLTTIFSKAFVSQRTEWDPALWAIDLPSVYQRFFFYLNAGNLHAASIHRPILFISLFTLPVFLYRAIKERKFIYIWGIVLLAALAGVALFTAFYDWDHFLPFKKSIFLLKTVHWDRLYFFQPFFWYTLFAISILSVTALKPKWRPAGQVIALLLIVFQCFFILKFKNPIRGDERVQDFVSILKKGAGKPDDSLSWKKVYSRELFQEIADYIHTPKKEYKVLGLGFYLGITTYNGFYTLDGYVQNYPLEYKHEFRKVIAPELDKLYHSGKPDHVETAKYFDHWGSVCALFHEDGSTPYFTKDSPEKSIRFNINSAAMKELGGKYIFSAVRIINEKENSLFLLKIFERKDSPWRIFLYQVL